MFCLYGFTLQSVSSYESCFFQQRYPATHSFPLSFHPDTTRLACLDQYMKPYIGRVDYLLQKQPDGEMESYRRMVTQVEVLEYKK